MSFKLREGKWCQGSKTAIAVRLLRFILRFHGRQEAGRKWKQAASGGGEGSLSIQLEQT